MDNENMDTNPDRPTKPFAEPSGSAIRVESVEKTCESFPAQWEGMTSDNRRLYAKYRNGFLWIGVGEPGDEDEFAGVCGMEVFGKELGHEYHGEMNYRELVEATAGVIEWPNHTIIRQMSDSDKSDRKPTPRSGQDARVPG